MKSFGDFRIKKQEVLDRINFIDSLEEKGHLEEALVDECLSLKLEFAKLVNGRS